jgi:hypothetical protein
MTFTIPVPTMLIPDAALLDLLRHTCDIWKPSTVVAVTPGDIEARDAPRSYVNVARGVACYYEPTPDGSSPSPPGRSAEKNQDVVSRWHMYAGVEVEDGYIIIMTGPAKDQTGKPNPYLRLCWEVQSNRTLNFSLPGRTADSQYVPALLSYGIKASDISNEYLA